MNSMRSMSISMTGILLLCVGCATGSKQKQLHVEGVMFRNTSSTSVSNVRLSVRKISGFVSCGPILVGNSCSTTFPVRAYQGNPITLRWTQAGKDWSSESFVIDRPPGVVPDKPATAVITIGEHGAVRAQLVQ